MIKDFLSFLKEYKIVSLAAAFIMGSVSTSLVNSLVKDIMMPILTPFLSDESWREATLNLGPVHIAYGSFIAELLNFIIIAFIIFILAKKILKEEKKKA